jgi:hypothetical protein
LGTYAFLMAGTASTWPLHGASAMNHALAVRAAPRHEIAFERYRTRRKVALECSIERLD